MVEFIACRGNYPRYFANFSQSSEDNYQRGNTDGCCSFSLFAFWPLSYTNFLRHLWLEPSGFEDIMPTIKEARSWYPNYDPAHGFSHILRVYRLCERLGAEENADLKILRAAALLHDAKSGADVREEHHIASAEFAQQVLHAECWENGPISAVQHCIRAHRFRHNKEQPQTIEAKVLYDADKLDAIGAVGVIRATAYAILNGQKIYDSPSQQFLSTGEREVNEPHTPYHEFIYKLQHIKDQLYTASGKVLAGQRHDFLVHFFVQFDAEINSLR